MTNYKLFAIYMQIFIFSFIYYSSNATNNLTSKLNIRRRKGSKRCDLFYGGERDKPT